MSEHVSIEASADAASPYAALFPGVRAARDPGSFSAGAPAALAALPVEPHAPPHPSLDSLCRLAIDGVILPTGRIVAHGKDWILCPRPGLAPARSISGLDEHSLVARVLRPAAAALERLADQQFLHRSIEPRNLFVGESGVQLGPFWLTPPAFLQPAIYETPAIASCPPWARGAGTAADDVYALGVTILALHLGETPLAGLPDSEIIERKLWLGSYAALTEGRRIPFALADIIAAMLADQPSQRPTLERLRRASALSGPATSSRKRVNAAIPMMLAGHEVWNAPQLAFLCGEAPEAAATALESGLVDGWLRRGLNEMVLAERIEAVVRPGGLRARTADPALDPNARARLLGRVAHMLDPESPCLWDRLRVMPDGIGGLLAGIGAHALLTSERICALLAGDALVARVLDQPPGKRRELASAAARRVMAAARTSNALDKLAYELNPAMACLSPALTSHPVISLSTVLPSLEAASEGQEGRVLDPHLLAFITVRRLAAGLRHVRAGEHAELRLLASLFVEFRPGPLPRLARRLAVPLIAELPAWPGSSRRNARRVAIDKAVADGDPASLLAIAADAVSLEVDTAAQAAAHARIRDLEAARRALDRSGPSRAEAALRFGREGVAVLGVAACTVAFLTQVLSTVSLAPW